MDGGSVVVASLVVKVEGGGGSGSGNGNGDI